MGKRPQGHTAARRLAAVFVCLKGSIAVLQFLHHLIEPTAVLMLFVMLYAVSVHIAPSVPTRTGSSLFFLICWIVVAVAAAIAWIVLVFS
jgi:hypothetical protein